MTNKATNYAGIDYGMGQANVDKDTGIRYGVINQHSVMSECLDDAEYDYGPPMCPKCQKQADEPSAFGDTFKDGRPDDYTDEPMERDDYVCVECKHFFGSESAFGDDVVGWAINDGEYQLTDCLQSDIFVLKSPYYTYAQFCSPCVPGAGSLDSPLELGTKPELWTESGFPKVYALGHDWFEGGKAPYMVFRVSDDSEVMPA